MRQPRRTMIRLAVLGLVLAGCTAVAAVTAAGPAAAESNGLALTPPMGFNDWNAYKCNVSESLIEQTADAMVTDGMKAAGYQYVNIDDCWLASSRDADGNLVADPTKFPDGIAAVAAYVHHDGLKLGIYEDAGTSTCAGYPGSLGHEAQDAALFASWGVDYLKYDQCNIPFANYPGMTHQQIDTMLYTTMSHALTATGRPILFSMCNGTDAAALPWLWGAPVSNMWRTTTDIADSFASMVTLMHQNVALAPYAGPGAWNDPDMLEIGNGGSTTTEYQSEFSLWSEMAAPLIAGTNLVTATPTTVSILTNKDVIAIDQDRLGKQGTMVSSVGGLDVLAKPLANGDVSVALFNENSTGAAISTTAAAVGLAKAPIYTLTDLWTKLVTESAGAISAYVPAHATVMYRLSTAHPVQALLDEQNTTLASAMPASIATGSSLPLTVTLTNNGVLPVTHGQFALSVPDGWTAKRTGTTGPLLLTTGKSSSATFHLTAPDSAPPISPASLTATAKLVTVKGATTDQIALSSTLVSPLPAADKTANTTGADAIFGGSGSNLAIDAAGTGVAPATTTTRGTTPAADSYAAIYLPAAASSSTTAQVTVDSEAATARGAKAGLMMRNDITSPSGSPQGVVLYVTGAKTVAMSWNATGGATVDTSSPATAAQTLPVRLRLVRSGSTYTGYYSTDGSIWTLVATATVADTAAAATQDVGVFQTSGSATAPAEADFSNLSTS